MKNLLIVFLIFINTCYAQTKEETQEWISEKINYYSYSDDVKVFHNYTITYDESNMIIKSNCRTVTGMGSGTGTGTRAESLDSESDIIYYIPIKDLYKIRFESKAFNVWLYLKTKTNSIKVDKVVNEMTNHVEILLERSILQDDMTNRMDKAFTNLIKLYGGSVGLEKF
jgi:hypothetical protein